MRVYKNLVFIQKKAPPERSSRLLGEKPHAASMVQGRPPSLSAIFSCVIARITETQSQLTQAARKKSFLCIYTLSYVSQRLFDNAVVRVAL